MKKICIALQTDDFVKGLQKLDKKIREDVLNNIKELVAKENDYNYESSSGKGPSAEYGSTLSNINKNTFVMKSKLRERFMATIIEDEKSKTYLWFFSGTHEKYNKLIEAKFLADKEKILNKNYKEQIKEQTDEYAATTQPKEEIKERIQNMRKSAHGKKMQFKR